MPDLLDHHCHDPDARAAGTGPAAALARRAAEGAVALETLPEEGLGHALRTPLTALHGALGLLGAGLAGDLPPDAHALVSIALRNCTTLEQVVEAHLGDLSQSPRCALPARS